MYRYFLTFCAYQRRRPFEDERVIELTLSQMLRAAGDDQVAVDAYCFMPDHVHLLIEGRVESSDCRRFISRAKQFSGFLYAQRFGLRLWQRYGFERVLRNEEDTLVVAKYILANPVRAQLVQNAEDYPFSGSLVYPVSAILEAAGEYRPNRS
jgi:REP-associated tyrosine transposase